MEWSRESFEKGKILLVDKPLDWTSFDVVQKIRNTIQVKIGHAGTLDPKATGLLILCTGAFTKKIEEFQNLDKKYTGTMILGATTPSYDTESVPVNFKPYDHITGKFLNEAASELTGETEQLPPIFSAVKQKGKPVYLQARKGLSPTMEPRKIDIKAFDITAYNLPEVSFSVHCSKGTYIRTLVHDFGNILGTGAYLKTLCRTAIGPYKLEDAWNLQKMISMLRAEPDFTKK